MSTPQANNNEKNTSAQKTILIVEDNDFLAEMLSSALMQAGYRVRIARDGKAGIECMNTEPPDALLLDLLLPVVNGYEVLEYMRGNERLRTVPTIIISNSGQPVQISRALALGVKDYAVKADLSVQEVVEKVHNLFPVLDTEGARYLVLIIEDDEMLRELAEMTLKDRFEVHVATNGEAARAAYRDKVFDVVLIDLLLPDASGFDLLAEIRANRAYDSSVCLIFSNLGQDSDMERAKALGADGYYVKANVPIRQLPDYILQHLKTKRTKLETSA